jgi:hypothetical protein
MITLVLVEILEWNQKVKEFALYFLPVKTPVFAIKRSGCLVIKHPPKYKLESRNGMISSKIGSYSGKPFS